MKHLASAPIVNPRLAVILSGEPDPMEDLSEDQSRVIFKLGTAYSITTHGRPALLVCGHFTMTKALYKARCSRCGEMIRAGYDYDAFRNYGHPDDFSWPDDPLRELHEKSHQGTTRF